MNKRRHHRPRHGLPPRVVRGGKGGQFKAGRRNQPWYRNVAIAVPLVDCAFFALLLAGIFGVPRLILLVRGQPAAEAQVPGATGLAADLIRDDEVDADPQLASSEPGYRVLTARAAKVPGRTVGKLLLVGPHAQMFPTISEAFAISVPGDIIEVRTNGPLLERGAARDFPDYRYSTARPITLRAGKGDFEGAVNATRAVLPADFVVTSMGPLAELWAAGIACGCDVTKLPVPPQATLEPFTIPAPSGI
jgi:hypothetical protein